MTAFAFFLHAADRSKSDKRITEIRRVVLKTLLLRFVNESEIWKLMDRIKSVSVHPATDAIPIKLAIAHAPAQGLNAIGYEDHPIMATVVAELPSDPFHLLGSFIVK
jgi:hypothetical protein